LKNNEMMEELKNETGSRHETVLCEQEGLHGDQKLSRRGDQLHGSGGTDIG